MRVGSLTLLFSCVFSLSSSCVILEEGEDAGESSDGTGFTAPTGTSSASGTADSTTTSSTESTATDTSATDTSATATTTTDTSATDTSATDTTDTTDTGDMCDGGPLDYPIAGCSPSPPPSTGDFGQDCVDRINQFRWECQCLPPLQRWSEAESCTDQQSADDQATNQPHGNFGACGEWAQNTCPNWGSESDIVGGCLQAMWDEGPGEPFEEHGHYINMASLDYTKVACGRSASSGGVWSNQNFAN